MRPGNLDPRLLSSRPSRLALTLSLSMLGGSVQAQELLESRPEQSRIVGGTEVEACAWPSAAMVITRDPNGPKDANTNLCTASLVHPEIIITAAHCFDGGRQPFGVAFTKSYNMLAKDTDQKLMHKVERCVQHPKWINDKTTQGQNLDFAYCKLKTPAKDIPIVPPLMGCELDVLEPGSEITLVGYGQRSGAKGSLPGDKYEVKTTFNGYSGGGEAQVGSQGKGSCYGDSGGPAYVNLKDKFGNDAGWRVFGVTSSGPSGCPGPANYGMIHKFIEFVEKDSKIEITPCFDAAGKWDPNKECKGAPLNPRKSSGDWLEQSCKFGPKGGWLSTCGDAAGGEDGSGEDSEGKDSSSGGEDSEGTEGDSEGSKSKDASTGGEDSPKDDSSEPEKDETEDESPSDNGSPKDPKSEKTKDSGKNPEKPSPDESSGKANTEEPDPGREGGCVIATGPGAGFTGALAFLGLLGLRRRRD